MSICTIPLLEVLWGDQSFRDTVWGPRNAIKDILPDDKSKNLEGSKLADVNILNDLNIFWEIYMT